MNIEDLRLLIDVVQEGSFAAVARRREVDPSTVSRAITALEHDLGARLFQRTSRKLSLTEAGGVYYERLRGVLDELERAREETREITTTPVGTLRVTASVAFGHALLVPLLPLWRQSFPSLSLDLLLTDSVVDLISERMDIAIRLGARPESGMVGARLLTSRYRVCVSPDYLRRAAALREPSDLADHDCVCFRWPGAPTRWQFRTRAGEGESVDINGSLLISSALSVRTAAIDGLGPTLLPHWLVAKDFASGKLVDPFPEHEITATDFETAAWLLYPTRTYLPLKVRAFIDFVKEHVARSDGGGVTRSLS